MLVRPSLFLLVNKLSDQFIHQGDESQALIKIRGAIRILGVLKKQG